MKLTLLTHYDAASALALHYILKQVPNDSLSVLYTRSEASKHNGHSLEASSLAALIQFEQSLTELPTVFKKAGAHEVGNVNNANDLTLLRSTQPDLILSIRHSTILKEAVIKMPRLGIINLHSGPLPAYQGVMATFWAMQRNEPQIGTTVHSIVDRSIDTGAIHRISRHEIDYKKSYLWNTLNLYRQGCRDLMKTVDDIRLTDTKLKGTPQQGPSNYFTFPSDEDFQAAAFPLFNQTDSIAEFL